MNRHPLINYLTNSIPISLQEEKLLLAKVKNRTYLKGQYLAQQRDVCKHLSFIVSGSTKTFHVDNEGREHIFRFAIENWWAADLPSFFEQISGNTNVQCLEKTEVIQISLQNLEELYLEIPQLEHFFRLIFQKAAIALEKRIIINLSYSAKERYLLFKEEYSEFEQRIPQYMIASYLGITKQYLSEIRHQLAHES